MDERPREQVERDIEVLVGGIFLFRELLSHGKQYLSDGTDIAVELAKAEIALTRARERLGKLGYPKD